MQHPIRPCFPYVAPSLVHSNAARPEELCNFCLRGCPQRCLLRRLRSMSTRHSLFLRSLTSSTLQCVWGSLPRSLDEHPLPPPPPALLRLKETVKNRGILSTTSPEFKISPRSLPPLCSMALHALRIYCHMSSKIVAKCGNTCLPPIPDRHTPFLPPSHPRQSLCMKSLMGLRG